MSKILKIVGAAMIIYAVFAVVLNIGILQLPGILASWLGSPWIWNPAAQVLIPYLGGNFLLIGGTIAWFAFGFIALFWSFVWGLIGFLLVLRK